MHGGTQRGGLAHPNVTHGRRAQRPNILEDAERVMSDPQVSDLGIQLAVNELRYRHAVEAADGYGATVALLEAVHAAAADALEADRNGDAEARTAALQRVQDTLTSGIGQAGAWAEVDDLAERKARLVVAEVRRRRELDKGLGPEEVARIVALQLDAIRAVFADYGIPRQAFADIANAFGEVFRGPPSRRLLSPPDAQV